MVLLLLYVNLSANIEEDFKNAIDKFNKDKYQDALKSFTKIRKKYNEGTKYDISVYYIARCYQKTGFNTEAIKFYKEFIITKPKSFFVTLAKYQYDKLAPGTPIEIPKESKSDTSVKKVLESDKSMNIVSKQDQTPAGLISDSTYFVYKPRLNLKTYIVKKGETLWDIAKKIYGDGAKYKRIAQLNNLENFLDISEDDTLIIDADVDAVPKDMIEKIRLKPKKIDAKEKDYKDVEDILNVGNHHFNNHQYNAAIIQYLKYISQISSKDKTYPEVIYKLALSNHYNNEVSEAVRYYKDYIKLFSLGKRIKEVYFNLGKLYYEILEDYSNSKYYFDKVLTFLPEDNLNKTAANYLKLVSRIRAENISLESEQNISDVEMEPSERKLELVSEESVPPEMQMYINKTKEDDLTPRLEIKESIEKYDKISPPQMKTVKPLVKFGDNATRIDYSNASFLKPTHYHTKKKKKIDFEERLNNYDADYFNKRGYGYKLKGMYEEAIKEYKKAIEYFPNNPVAYNNMAFLFAELGTRLNEAVNLVYKSLNLDSKHKGFYFDTLGWVYFKQGEYLKSKDTLEKAVFFNESALKRYHLGLVYNQLKMFDRAYKQFQRAVILAPDSDIAFKSKLELRLLD